MRDFYDIYILTNLQMHNIDNATLKEAFDKTSEQRGSIFLLSDADLILKEISESVELFDLWENYQRKFDYAADIIWGDVMDGVKRIVEIVK